MRGVQAADEAVTDLENSVNAFMEDLLGCGGVNRLYQALVVLICDSATESFGSTTDLLLAFAVIFALTEIFARLLADAWRDDTDETYAGAKVA